jgi:hypothetical protein
MTDIKSTKTASSKVLSQIKLLSRFNDYPKIYELLYNEEMSSRLEQSIKDYNASSMLDQNSWNSLLSIIKQSPNAQNDISEILKENNTLKSFVNSVNNGNDNNSSYWNYSRLAILYLTAYQRNFEQYFQNSNIEIKQKNFNGLKSFIKNNPSHDMNAVSLLIKHAV